MAACVDDMRVVNLVSVEKFLKIDKNLKFSNNYTKFS